MSVADLFPVTTVLPAAWDACRDKQIVFHGVNKSGSLALTKVLRSGYHHAGRDAEFFSHYHGQPKSIEDLIRVGQTHVGPCFLVGHYLWNAMPPLASRVWFSQFRHPLPRVSSCYSWLRNKHLKTHGSVDGFPSIEDFVVATGGKAHSQIAQFGIGFGPGAALRRKSMTTREIFESAKEGIENDMVAVGIAEHFEETIFLVAKLCGLDRVPAWKRDTRNPTRTLAVDLPDQVVNLIKEVYAYDFELYEWILSRFREQNQAVDFGSGLAAYKAACEAQYKDRIV